MPTFGDIDVFALLIKILAILIALSVHEAAHAFMASRLGDPTAHNEGRLTLNPISHLDPLGTLMFVLTSLTGFGFGWAKPVPVNPHYFAHPKRGMALTAIAGPISNLILAITAVIGLIIVYGGMPPSIYALFAETPANPGIRIFFEICSASLFINLGLAAFNLLPIAPLDGSKVLQLFVPWQYETKYEDFLRVGPYILLALIIFGSALPIDPISWWVGTIVEAIINSINVLIALISTLF